MSFTVKSSVLIRLIYVRKHSFTAKKCYMKIHSCQIIV